MPIPKFDGLTLPLLRLASDGKLRKLAEYRKLLGEELGLTPEEMKQPLPNNPQPIFTNRVAWAAIYLHRAGLLERPRRGHYAITKRGQEVLASDPRRIGVKDLQKFPEFVAWQAKKKEPKKAKTVSTDATPLEALEASYQQLRAELAQDLLDAVKDCSPHFFERLVLDLLVAMGYGGSRLDAAMAVGHGADEGIDGIIKEDRLGLDQIYLQAKRWQNTVGRPEIQKFVGALQGKHARKGVFITTSEFSQGAIDYAANIASNVVLIDGTMLASLMIDYDLGVGRHATYEVKRIDTDYFIEE